MDLIRSQWSKEKIREIWTAASEFWINCRVFRVILGHLHCQELQLSKKLAIYRTVVHHYRSNIYLVAVSFKLEVGPCESLVLVPQELVPYLRVQVSDQWPLLPGRLWFSFIVLFWKITDKILVAKIIQVATITLHRLYLWFLN